MAKNLISSLFVKLTANTTEFQTGMRRAEKTVSRSRKQFDTITRSVRNFAGALGLVVSAGALMQMSRSAINLGSRLDDVSRKLGVTTEFIQTLGYAARETGVRTEAAEMGMQRFVRRVGEAQQGTGELYKTLEQLNIQLRLSDGRARDITQIFDEYADAIKDAESQQERLRLAFKAFDSEGAAMVTLLSDGSDGFSDWTDKAKKLKQVMDEETIGTLAKLENQAESLGVAFVNTTAHGINFFVEALETAKPIVEWYTDALGMWLKLSNAMPNPFRGTGNFKRNFKPYAPKASMDGVPGSIFKMQRAMQDANIFLMDMNSGMNEFSSGVVAAVMGTTDLASAIKAMTFEGWTGIKTMADKIPTWMTAAASGVESLSYAIEDGLVNATTQGKDAFKDMARFILAEIQRIIIRVAILRPLFGGIGGMIGDNALGNAFSTAFGGGRAVGGPVAAGRSYLVGERGPELFTPAVSGGITPNGGIGGGNTYNIDARGASVEAVSRLERMMLELNRSFEPRAIAAISRHNSRIMR